VPQLLGCQLRPDACWAGSQNCSRVYSRRSPSEDWNLCWADGQHFMNHLPLCMVCCRLQVVVSTVSPHYGEEACLQVGSSTWPHADYATLQSQYKQ
jgi:hypothetical protein